MARFQVSFLMSRTMKWSLLGTFKDRDAAVKFAASILSKPCDTAYVQVRIEEITK